MIQSIKKVLAKVVEGMFAISGALTSLAIVLIVIFLFKEGISLFSSPTVEQGYGLYMHHSNTVKHLTPPEIKEIFDGEITTWDQVGGEPQEIRLFRFDEIFSLYDESEMGEEYERLPELLGEVIQKEPNIIAYLPEEYAPNQSEWVKKLGSSSISLSEFFAGKEWLPTATPAPLFGTLPLLMGTLVVSFLAILIALPLGLGCAMYLSELASPKMRSVIKPAVELLAGIPSVVYGFFGLVVLAPIVQNALDLPVGETALTGSILLAIMALPTIITVTEDALRNTPRSMREASLALGATRWQTLYKVVVPYASSGISAAIVLGIGRAVGETMAVLMVTGNAAVMPSSITGSVRTIPATIAAELGEAPAGGAHYQALFLLGGVLFLLTIAMSITAEFISKNRNSNEL